MKHQIIPVGWGGHCISFTDVIEQEVKFQPLAYSISTRL